MPASRTLMKILAGLYTQSDGELIIGGQSVQLGSPRDARERGIEMVYQDLALAGNLRIDESIFLGRELTRGVGPFRLIDHKANQARAQEHLDKLRIHVKSVSQRVEELSGGQRQAVAIARATAFDAKVVIMDEPTAALAVKEVAKVLDLIKDLRTHGIAVILISHRLDDVFYVCDRVMALFHGRNFAEAPLTDVTRNDVIGWIMGNRTTDTAAHGLRRDRGGPRPWLRRPPRQTPARPASPMQGRSARMLRVLDLIDRYGVAAARADHGRAVVPRAAGCVPERAEHLQHPAPERLLRDARPGRVHRHRDRGHRPVGRLQPGALDDDRGGPVHPRRPMAHPDHRAVPRRRDSWASSTAWASPGCTCRTRSS